MEDRFKEIQISMKIRIYPRCLWDETRSFRASLHLDKCGFCTARTPNANREPIGAKRGRNHGIPPAEMEGINPGTAGIMPISRKNCSLGF